MQVVPRSWFGTYHDECGGSDLFDAHINACYGVRILQYYLELCDGVVGCALRRYNGAITHSKGDLYIEQVANRRGDAQAWLQ